MVIGSVGLLPVGVGVRQELLNHQSRTTFLFRSKVRTYLDTDFVCLKIYVCIVHRDDEHRVAFPALSARPKGPKSASNALAKSHLGNGGLTSDPRKPKIQNVYLQTHSGSRTPRRNSRGSRPTTPTTSITASTVFRPKIQRANSLTGPSSAGLPTSSSWTGIGPVPKSAKRWARTAHLHEVKSPLPSSAAVAESSSRSAKNRKDADGGEEDEKENRRVVLSASVKLAASTPKDTAKTLNDGDMGIGMDTERDVFIDDTPSRTFSRPQRLGQSNGHLPPPILVSPDNHNHVGTSNGGVQQSDRPGIIRRWNTTSAASPSGDGDDENLWVDTDTSVDGGDSSDIDGDFEFGFNEGSK